MKERRLEKKKLVSLLGEMRGKYKVFAPVKVAGDITFKEVENPQEVPLQYGNSTVPPKALFFPQAEKLLTVEKGTCTEEKPPDEKRILFGLRPCDSRSLSLLDKVFSGPEFEDPYYLGRRKNTIIIALACNNPRATCFCASLDGGPFSEEGADIITFELEDSYLLKSLNSRGEDLIKRFSDLFGDPKESDLAQREKFKKAAAEKISSGLKLDKLAETLNSNFDNPLWDEIYEKCLGCGVCTYLCPTCHCFDITDEYRRRIRSWDTCQFPLFTLHASGHNPRPSEKERVRQRIMHKFSYCPENFGETFCVGCGRCVRLCPVNLDLRSLINQLSEKLEK